MHTLFVILEVVVVGIWAYRAGYRGGHMDGLLERQGHQPITHRGRKLHRHLTLWAGEDGREHRRR